MRLSIENVDRAKKSRLNLLHWVNAQLNEFYNGGISMPTRGVGENKVSSDLVVGMSEKFISWTKANRFSKSYQKSLENDLIKHFKVLVLTSPQNVIDYISRMKTTSKYPILALRKYIKYLEETGSLQSKDADSLRRVLNVKKSQPDT
jgi:intergrase/recombinase